LKTTIDYKAATRTHHLRNFKIISKDVTGAMLNSFVKQVNDESFEAFVQEKDAILQLHKDKHGAVSCRTEERNEDWVKEICATLTRRIVLYRGRL
jgi:hypothetical protein